jgi:hypothetical protein
MQIVARGLVDKPDIPLIARPAPVMIVAVTPAVQDRLVLPLVVGPAERERMLRPDHERAPLAAGRRERTLQRMQLR